MKVIGRISLFCIAGLLGFAAGICSNAAYLHFFYPGREIGQEPIVRIEETDLQKKEPEGVPVENILWESIPADSKQADVITCDTVFAIEEYDKNTEMTALHEEEIPGKYIGMDRENFVDAMESYELSPPLEEQRRGLLSVEVLSFSGSKVLVRKSYQVVAEPEEEVFYLVAENHYITVYRQDMQSVYLYTDICIENLPEELQEEIIQKKLISGEADLYHFLESYSS